MSAKQINSPLLTIPEAADYLRIKRTKLYNLVADGELFPVRIGDRVLFSRQELDRYIAARTAVRHSIEREPMAVGAGA